MQKLMLTPRTLLPYALCMSTERKRTDPKTRLEEKIQKDVNGCWNFTGSLHQTGYGHFYYNGVHTDAHRASWMIFNGLIPDSLHVCHTCDNKKCVNPDHLFLGTRSDNMRDCVAKGRHFTPSRKSHCIRGHDLALSKGFSNCRQCAAIRAKQFFARKKAA